ncbi:uncharacterized protein EDB91DRAFT_1088166, partial [Suillus paluster]|uniref:uncharacterized protein n=1 Tax=Suillus paluster TaxID=48578 RepID=UPI001B86BF63
LLPRDQYLSHFRRGVRLTGNQGCQASSASFIPQVLAKESYHTVPPAMVEAEPPSMPQWLASTIRGSLNPPQAQAEFVERISRPVRNDDALVSPESRKRPYQSPTPSPLPQHSKKRPYQSPTPSPLPQRLERSMPKRNVPTSSVSRSGHGVSAYTFNDDPDANWSTITKPEKKKSKTFKHGNMGSGIFRLPGIAVGNPKGRSTGVTQTEKKCVTQTKSRVITYLPPPPLQRTVARKENPPQVGERYAPDDDAFPVPIAQPPQESGPASPLLQPDSDDLTLVGEVDEQVFAFDIGGVEARYPKIRKLIKENRVRLPELLGLPSCGIVWRDEEVAGVDDGGSGNREIKINIWPCGG